MRRSSAKKPDKFQPNDRIFAKIKGWPPWPAKVLNKVDGKAESYMILFYGTYDKSVVKPDSMFAYNEDNKAKYKKNKNSRRWKEAMEEIENNTPIGEAGPLEEAAAPVEAMEVTNDTDDDCELMINEGPASQPPVVTKEVSKPSSNSSSRKGKSEPAKAVARGGSKASLSKRDSISSTSCAPNVSTPAAGPTTPGTDMVTRSGRKIIPKRFADDEISTPTPTQSSSQDESSEGPPTKRPKRGGKTPPSVKSTPVTAAEPKVESPTRARMVVGKGKGAPPPKTPPTSEKISPDILAPVPKLPTPKPDAAQRIHANEPVKPDSPSKKSIAASISYEGNVVAIKSPAVIPPASASPPSKPAVLSLASSSTPSILKKRKAEKSPVKQAPPPTVENKQVEDISKKPVSATPTKESVKPASATPTKESVKPASATPQKESVKPADSSVKKTPLSMEAMMAAVSSIRAPVIPSPTSPVKPAVAPPASASLSTPESSAAGATAVKKRKVEKTYSRTPTTTAEKGAKDGEDTTKKPAHSEFAIKPSDSSKKASVSFEAMMAAVSSIKAPLTPKIKNKSGPASEQQKMKQKIDSGTAQQPKLISASALGAAGQQPMSVEILRQKMKGGGTTVVLVQQQQKGEDGEDVEGGGGGGGDGDDSDADSYDEYMYFDREFEFEHEEDIKADREFERFHIALKKFLQLPGRWTMGGVQWDPQGKRKVILISEPEIPPNGRPIVKRCLQFFEDKSIRVFIDQMDMTDVFGMTCYAEKEDVASLVVRVADASSCCGVPEMVVDDLVYFPDVRKRNKSYFAPNCPGVIANDEYDPICTACKEMQILVKECRRDEKLRLQERRIRSEEKMFEHPFGKALYNMFDDLVDETDPSKPKKKRTKETFFRKFLHDTRLKVNGDSARTERVYIEKPISVDSVSQSFQDIVSKLGFNVPNAKKRPSGGLLPRPSAPTHPTTSTPRSSAVSRIFPGSTSNLLKGLQQQERKQSLEHISMPFAPGSSFTLDDGQEYELIGEVEPGQHEFVEMKATPSANQQQQQFEIIEVDDETLARLAGSKNQVVMLPESTTAGSSIVTSSGFPITTRIDANDPNLSQILKAINTSHGFKVS